MNILLAPNAFKGCLSALQVTQAIDRGLKKASPDIQTFVVPIADGGEGTVEIFIQTVGGTYRTCEVENAVGQKIEAQYGILNDGRTAILELAAASGMGKLASTSLSPMKASTFGTGQLILDALDQGCKRIILSLGGSASTDGGTGILSALGVKFLNESGYAIPTGGGGLAFLEKIDLSGLDPRVRDCEFILPCDVENPLLGPEGTAAIYAPQKGAMAEQVTLLEENLSLFNDLMKETLQVDVSSMKHGGAAGGVSAGLHAFLGAKLISGIDFMLHEIGFDSHLRTADYLITAEGRLDHQSLQGKGPYAVARRAKVRGIPAFCITGQVPEDFNPSEFDAFHAVFPIPTAPMTLETAISHAEALIEFTAWQVGAMLILTDKR